MQILRKARTTFPFKQFLAFHFIILALLSCVDSSKTPTASLKVHPESPKVFDRITADKSGLRFNNALTENLETLENLFNYDYFYNGAGVGIEDLNNDGLQDIFFCGNQVGNKLFLNKGGMSFEDVSNVAAINDGKTWSNGVTFVDINNDNWSDIYVSQGGPNSRQNRKNLLYINQTDGTFVESADEYGLADMGISTQSVFFDFDQDGDLDCFVMNENEFYGVDPISLYKLIDEKPENNYFNSSHLYENQDGKFVDVTQRSGLQRPIFGLGVSVSDINNDGLLDLYVASDYYIPDALFINNGDGTFDDKIKEYTQQISFFGMGMDIADINNDNLQDIFVLDMAANDHVRSKTLMASMNTKKFDYLVNQAGFHHQYMYNSLQLNQGGKTFTNIAQATQMANTDWSWSVLLSDFDHDGDKDVYITNGYRRYALDNDLQRRVFEAKMKYKNNVPLAVKKRLYEEMPSEKLPNILYENNGGLQFKEAAKKWGLADLSFSNGAAIGDLDNDGDLDIVTNNLDENCFLYQNMTVENNGGNYLNVKAIGTLSESFPKIKINYNRKSQFIESRRVRGYRSSHQNIAHFGVGHEKIIDTVQVLWPSGKLEEKYDVSSNSVLTFNEADAVLAPPLDIKSDGLFQTKSAKEIGITFEHHENTYDDFDKEILLPYKQSNLGPFMASADLNGDGLTDVFIGAASGQAGKIYLQQDSGNFVEKISDDIKKDKTHEDMESVFFDFDNDGDLDLYVVSGGNEFLPYSSYYADRLYLNDGAANFIKFESKALTTNPKSGKAVVAIDYDKDGDKDLIIGNRIEPQNYPIPVSSTVYENKNGMLTDVTSKVAPYLSNFGIINDLIATDFDNDGWEDFIAVGEWTGIGLFKNNQGIFSNISKSDKSLSEQGWWFSVNETDINNDGLTDYIVGNVGLNLKFKASKKKPFKIFANDFDDNGTTDIVLSKKYNGEYVPVRGRECSSQQMPFIQQKFESYSEFANAKLVDIYGEKLDTGYEDEVTEFQSILLINLGDGKFEKQYLPIEAQLFPLLTSSCLDLNDDGYEDIIIGGNIYETEVETPRLDAISGLVLLSNQKDGYNPLSFSKSSIYLKGNVKDIEVINTGGKNLLLTTQNNGPILVHEMVN